MRHYHNRVLSSQHHSVLSFNHNCDMKTLKERLVSAREAAGLTQGQLGKAVGSGQSLIGNLEAGTRAGSSKMPQIAAALGVEALWLAEGEGPRTRPDASARELPKVAPLGTGDDGLGHTAYTGDQVAGGESLPSPTDAEFALVQQLDLSASCGHGKFTEHVVVKGGLAFKRSSLRDIGVQEDNARIIYASGQSMEPNIKHGRVVLVDMAQKTPTDGKVFLICDPDGAIYLKRLVREFHPQMGGMAWIMRSDNPNKQDHPDKLLPQDSRTTIVGRAVWTDMML